MGQYLYWVLAGLLFGIANVIPGVSGGTIAVVFGIYERLISFISHIRKRLKDDWKFILFLGIGAAVGVLGFTKFMDWVLSNHPGLANGFFVGVMAGSLPMLAKKAFLAPLKSSGKPAWRISPSVAGCLLATLAVMVVMFLVKTPEAVEETAAYTLADGLWLFVLGAVAAACMIIPGISGSFVLVMLGGYGMIVGLVSQVLDYALAFDFAGLISCWVVIPFGLGVLGGLIYCAKLIQFLLRRFERQTYGAILGFVLGSILMIFPGFGALDVWTVLLMIVGAAAILIFERLGVKN